VTAEELSALLDVRRNDLLRFVERHGGATLRHEAAEDLVQGVHLRAVSRADEFEYRSDREFEAWMYSITRAHLADRNNYWTAAKRRPERLLRLTRADGTDPGAAREPRSDTPGPATRAGNADSLRKAEEALDLLLPRDSDLVRGVADGRTIDEDAERLGVSYAAAQRARLRALERYRRAFQVLALGG
jgi:RNA polymerase sigma factor (sigma-70 family)